MSCARPKVDRWQIPDDYQQPASHPQLFQHLQKQMKIAQSFSLKHNDKPSCANPIPHNKHKRFSTEPIESFLKKKCQLPYLGIPHINLKLPNKGQRQKTSPELQKDLTIKQENSSDHKFIFRGWRGKFRWDRQPKTDQRVSYGPKLKGRQQLDLMARKSYREHLESVGSLATKGKVFEVPAAVTSAFSSNRVLLD